ncbi:hypothetical protein BP5796_02407 [Coleophoma crateriformis]|uniref:Aminodeoxychorismate lyase n=1 Tax=Coleophoma crateriformis TaxID=565419 RepID=A0A3D8SY31_9HELO|nr:hypothetical protein BP5796_02407 [Coleophoma crateriformis]
MAPDFQLFSSLRYDPILLSNSVNTQLSPGKQPSPFYMLEYHRDRILQAAEHFGWSQAIAALEGTEGLTRLASKLGEYSFVKSLTPFRVRVLVAHDGTITAESNSTLAVSLENLYPARIPPPLTAAPAKVSPLTGGALTLGDNDTVAGDARKGEAWTILADSAKTTPNPYTAYKTTSREMYNTARERVGIVDLTLKKEVLLVSDQDEAIMEGSMTSVFFWRNGKWTTPPISSGGQAGTTRRWLLEKGLCVEEVVKIDSLTDGEECWISNGVRGMNWGKVKLS